MRGFGRCFKGDYFGSLTKKDAFSRDGEWWIAIGGKNGD